ADRSMPVQLPAFIETVALTRWERAGAGWHCISGPCARLEEGEKVDYAACVLGLRDYGDKIGFPGVGVGLSGGIDAALCAAVAAGALGASRVRCLMLPYRYTAQESLADAAQVAKALAVQYEVVPIASAVEGLETSLAPLFAGRPRDVTEENLQS